MNRAAKGFIVSPLVLGLLMSLFNALFGDSEFHFTSILIGFVIYSLFAYLFTLVLAVPALPRTRFQRARLLGVRCIK